MNQLDWIAVAEEKAALCKSIGDICNRVPSGYQQMGIEGIRAFKRDREAAMKVAGSKRSSVHELTAAPASMRRYA